MAFTDTDRDNIRDIFGYPWSMNDCISDLLTSAFNEHGDSVVTTVQRHISAIHTLQDTIDTELDSPDLVSQTITGEASQTYAQGSGVRRNDYKVNQLKQKIRLAIDPYNQLYPRSATALLRS